LSGSGFTGLKDYREKMEEEEKLYFKYWGKARKKEDGGTENTVADGKIFFGNDTICHIENA
jgi:hypothetical protein